MSPRPKKAAPFLQTIGIRTWEQIEMRRAAEQHAAGVLTTTHLRRLLLRLSFGGRQRRHVPRGCLSRIMDDGAASPGGTPHASIPPRKMRQPRAELPQPMNGHGSKVEDLAGLRQPVTKLRIDGSVRWTDRMSLGPGFWLGQIRLPRFLLQAARHARCAGRLTVAGQVEHPSRSTTALLLRLLTFFLRLGG